MKYIVERRNAWGKEIYAVLETDGESRGRTMARCDTFADAMLLTYALTEYNILARKG